jgi:tRNA A-37 threonylcarbamoyl transferase component Bud32
MKSSNWERIQEIYHAAMALPHLERNDFVTNACAGDGCLGLEIRTLLEAADSSNGFLNSSVIKLGLEDALIGTTIDNRYQVIRKLGSSGGMSRVYLAHDLNLKNHEVVVKILARELADEPYPKQKFEQEVEVLLRIDHFGVVPVLDRGKLPDSRPYIVLKYIDGDVLRSQIPNEGMDLGRTASILKEIGAALEHVHEQGVFHRDLKPENIMLRHGSASVVLIDFGIAKLNDSVFGQSTGGVVAGTLAYMSPERLRNEPVNATGDIYSMAVIAYELVTGRRPFNPTSPAQLLELERAGVGVKPRSLRPSLPAPAEAVILRGLSFNPKSRYQRPREFADDLANALIVGTVTQDKHWFNRSALVVSSVVMILAVAAYLFALYKSRTPTVESGPKRSITYWLTVQKMRGGKEYQQPFKSHGQETFESDDKFRLNISSGAPGYLYVFNEGPAAAHDTSFRMMYPNQLTNNGSATVGANQTFESEWMTFRGPAGDENFWIVWSVSPVSQFESVKTVAFRHPRGGLSDENLVSVKEFLRMKQSETKVRVYHYKTSQTSVVRGSGNTLIMLSQFEHR